MELLERYLAAVARELPKAQAADIVAELRDTLMSQIEDKERELGHPLTKQELSQLLKAFGHPLNIAARYRKTQFLIGPEIFPFWWASLRVILGIGAALFVIGLAWRLGFGQSAPADLAKQASAAFWTALFEVFGVVTLVFAVMERLGGARALARFNPATLPPVRARRRGRFSIASEITAGLVFVLWWAGFIRFREFLPIPPGVRIELAPMFVDGFYAPILAYSLAEIALNALEFAKPGWIRINAALSLVKNLAGCALMGLVLQLGHWVHVSGAAMPSGGASMEFGFDSGLRIGFSVTLIVYAFKAGAAAWCIARPAPQFRAPGKGGNISAVAR